MITENIIKQELGLCEDLERWLEDQIDASRDEDGYCPSFQIFHLEAEAKRMQKKLDEGHSLTLSEGFERGIFV